MNEEKSNRATLNNRCDHIKQEFFDKYNTNLRYYGLKKEEVIEIAECLASKNTTVSSLDLYGNKLRDHIVLILNALSVNTTLTSIDLSNCNISSKGSEALEQALAVNKTLTHISLEGNFIIGDEKASVVANALLVNTTLLSIDLADTHISSEGGIAIGRALATNTTLTHISLQGNALNDEGATPIIDALHINKVLKSINLASTSITSKGATSIGHMLSNNVTLTEICTHGNLLGDEGALSLVNALSINTTIKIFDLGLRDISIKGATAIGLALSNNTTLAQIGLYDTSSATNAVSCILNGLKSNSTLTSIFYDDGVTRPEIDHVLRLNRVQLRYPALKFYRDSIPERLTTDEKVEDYLKKLIASSAPMRSMKVIVLGNGRIGKSTFVEHLTKVMTLNPLVYSFKKKFGKKKMASTVGMECSTVKLADGKVSLFDFGGQLEYTVTHQFFLSNKMVIYLVCFDLVAPPAEQRRQIESWLSYLNSLLCNNSTPHFISHKKPVPEWKVMIAGTRLDKKHPQTILLQSTLPFQQKFSSLPMHDNVFYFSTLHDSKSFKGILHEIVDQCNQIMNAHSKFLPTYYTLLKDDIASFSASNALINMASLPPKWKKNTEETIQALEHLHAIGEIVLFGKDKICTNPEVISKLMAKFVSPDEVRAKLLWDDNKNANLLKKSDMQTVLQVKEFSHIDDELELLSFFKVCFELSTKDKSNKNFKLYLFPSLSDAVQSIHFTIRPSPSFYFGGVQITAPEGKVFVPGLLCQLIVTVCSRDIPT